MSQENCCQGRGRGGRGRHFSRYPHQELLLSCVQQGVRLYFTHVIVYQDIHKPYAYSCSLPPLQIAFCFDLVTGVAKQIPQGWILSPINCVKQSKRMCRPARLHSKLHSSHWIALHLMQMMHLWLMLAFRCWRACLRILQNRKAAIAPLFVPRYGLHRATGTNG